LNTAAAQPIKKLTWLVFIIGKIKLLHSREDITEMAFLLFACIYWAVMLSPSDIQSTLIDGKLPTITATFQIKLQQQCDIIFAEFKEEIDKTDGEQEQS